MGDSTARARRGQANDVEMISVGKKQNDDEDLGRLGKTPVLKVWGISHVLVEVAH